MDQNTGKSLCELGLPQTWPWSLHLRDILEKHFVPQVQNHITVFLQNVAGWFNEIGVERAKQDLQWGGPEHDATHSRLDWISLIAAQLEKAALPHEEFKERMVKVAALAVAAMEADSKKGGPNG